MNTKKYIIFYKQISCQEAILRVSNLSKAREYCIVYNHSWTPLPQSVDDAVSFKTFCALFCFSHSLFARTINNYLTNSFHSGPFFHLFLFLRKNKKTVDFVTLVKVYTGLITTKG